MNDSPSASTLLDEAASGAPASEREPEPGRDPGEPAHPAGRFGVPARKATSPGTAGNAAYRRGRRARIRGARAWRAVRGVLRRPSGVAVVGAALVLGLALGGGVGLSVGRATAPEPLPTAAPLTGSGPIGPWQRYGHASAGERTMRVAARHEHGVLLLGDSVAARLRDDLSRALTAEGRPMSWDHWNGRPTHGAADSLVAIDAAGFLPPTLVMVSGENDIFEPDLFAVQIERVMRTAGPDREVYWMTLLVSRPATAEADEANSALLVQQLEDAAKRHPNLHLVRWAEHVLAGDQATREALMPDGVHPSPEGTKQLATMVLNAMQQADAAR